jgi:hypothetical protein
VLVAFALIIVLARLFG